jgi:hypothetical protein
MRGTLQQRQDFERGSPDFHAQFQRFFPKGVVRLPRPPGDAHGTSIVQRVNILGLECQGGNSYSQESAGDDFGKTNQTKQLDLSM